MKLSSPEFRNNEMIPEKFTCDGEDINPVLIIEDVPEETQSLALIVEDHDSSRGVFIHWVLFNIPPGTRRIEKNSAPGIQGRNDFGNPSYGGPCPGRGVHHYHFKIHALDTELDLKSGAAADKVSFAMMRHIRDSAVLIGAYQDKRERILAKQP